MEQIKTQKVIIKTIELNSAKGKIRKRQEIIIKAISSSNAWHALYLTKQGTFGFLTNPVNKIKNNSKPPNGKDFSIIATGNVRNSIAFKKEYL